MQDRLVCSYTAEPEKYIELGSKIATHYYVKVT